MSRLDWYSVLYLVVVGGGNLYHESFWFSERTTHNHGLFRSVEWASEPLGNLFLERNGNVYLFLGNDCAHHTDAF